MSNVYNFFSKYYKSFNKEKIIHNIVNLIFAILIFIIFYTIAKICFNKIKNIDPKKISKDENNLKIPKPNQKDSKVFSELHRKFLAEISFYIIIFIGIIFAISILNVNINSFLILLGTIGVGIAFGFNKYVNEVISGIGILVLNYFNLGDLIQVNNNIGYVQKFNLLNTSLMTFYGESIIIPNSLISSDSLTNLTKNKVMFVLIPAVLSNTQKIDYPKLLKIVAEKVKLSKYVIDKNEVVAIVRDMARVIESGEGGTTIAVKAKIESKNYFNGMNDIKLILRQTLEDENIRLFDWHCSVKEESGE